MSIVTIKSGLKVEDFVYKKISIVEFTGSLTEQNIFPIKKDLIAKFPGYSEYVAFNLAKVPFISVETLKELIDLNKLLKLINKKIFIIKLQKPVYKFLSGTAIAELFTILENEEQVFQQYLTDKNLREDEVDIFSSCNKLSKWYNNIQNILVELKSSDNDSKINYVSEDLNQNLSVIIVSNNIVIGRGLNDVAREYKMEPHLVSIENLSNVISKTDNLAGYIIDGFKELEEIKLIIMKIRNAESDYCKSMLPIIISSTAKLLESKIIMRLHEMIYTVIEDGEDREPKIIKKIRNLYENIDKVIVYLTLNIKFEITTEICNFYFTGNISADDAEIFDAFLLDDFVINLFKEMFTVNFNYYDCLTADSLFFTTIHNISEKFDYCVHFINKRNSQVNMGIKNTSLELNINVL